MTFDTRDYWDERHQHTEGLRAVGNISFSQEYNHWLYRAKGIAVRRFLRRYASPNRTMRALDIGCGQGFGLEQWHRVGAVDLAGIDLSFTAIDRLRGRFPSANLSAHDITRGPSPLAGGTFDAASAFDVLYHIVDDDAYQCCLVNVAASLSPGGIFVFTESLLPPGGEAPGRGAPHRRFRDQSSVFHWIREAGFSVIAVRPLYVMMERPVRDPRFRIVWKAISRVARIPGATGYLASAGVAAMEVLASSLFHARPSLELYALKRVK